MPVLLPQAAHGRRDAIVVELARNGVGVAQYFSPHLAEQPYFKETCVLGDLTTTGHVSRRILSLPLFDRMSMTEVAQVCEIIVKVLGET